MSERFKGLIFVGEKRSSMAIKNGWSWNRCQLEKLPQNCAVKLFKALNKCGLDPAKQIFLNLFHDDGRLNQPVVNMLREISNDGYPIVGMGNTVQRVLLDNDIIHRKLVHPAARGNWEKSELYEAHVAQILML